MQTIHQEMNLPDILSTTLAKNQWKKMVKRKVMEMNESDLKESFRKYLKLKYSDMLKEGFGLKDYFQQLDLHDSRHLFKHCCSVSRFYKMNYKNYPIYSQQLWKCSCGEFDSEKHSLICTNFADLREKLDLNDIKDICCYLHEVFLRHGKC